MINILVTCFTQDEVNAAKSTVRALSTISEFRVIGVAPKNFEYINFPRNSIVFGLSVDSDLDFINKIRELCQQNDIAVIIPCLDGDVQILSEIRNEFRDLGINMAVPSAAAIKKTLNKYNLTKTLKRIKLPLPKSIKLSSINDVKLIKSLSFPIIAKPVMAYSARDVQIYDSMPLNLGPLLNLIHQENIIVQEYIPGGDGSLHHCGLLFDRAGQQKLFFQSRSAKTKFHFGGPSVAGKTVFEPSLKAQAERLMKAVGPWFGPVTVEAKRHADTGEFYIIDVNPRVWGYSRLAEDAGLSFPYATVLAAVGRDFRTRSDYLLDVHMERTERGDISTYRSSNGKRVKLTGSLQRNLVALCPPTTPVSALQEICRDVAVDAVLIPTEPHDKLQFEHQKLFTWNVPDEIDRNDLPAWAAHLLRARQVRILGDGRWTQHGFDDLWRKIWLGDGPG